MRDRMVPYMLMSLLNCLLAPLLRAIVGERGRGEGHMEGVAGNKEPSCKQAGGKGMRGAGRGEWLTASCLGLALCLHLIEAYVPPPARYPDLHVLLLMIV